MHHLSGLRRLQSQLARHQVDAFRVTQGSVFQVELAVHFHHAVALNLQGLDLVSVFDRLEVLPGIRHDQQEQAGQRHGEVPHFAAAARIFHLHQA